MSIRSMTSSARLEARTIGRRAAEIVKQKRHGLVLAVFDQSVYLDAGGDLFAIVGEALYDGPINIRLAGTHSIGNLELQPGQDWEIAPGRLCRQDGLAIDLETASIWTPSPVVDAVDRLKARAGLHSLLDRLDLAQRSNQGLLDLVLGRPVSSSAIDRAAAPLLAELRASMPGWLCGSSDLKASPVQSLIGLGAGLTPSGDDLLGGILITCHRLGARRRAAELDGMLRPLLGERTNPISAAHLKAASAGLGAAPLHDLLDAVIDDRQEDMPDALDAVLKIGHSSGADALGGIILTLESHLASPVADPADRT
jgi:hypothetical protein